MHGGHDEKFTILGKWKENHYDYLLARRKCRRKLQKMDITACNEMNKRKLQNME
jgi:hypothetical protein